MAAARAAASRLRAAVAVAVAALASGAPPRNYTNPVLAEDVPDPGVIRVGGTWYAATTGGAPSGGYFPVHTSPDLGAPWAAAGSLFTRATWPAWADGGTAWAPEVHAVGTGHVAYFATRLAATGALCVGAAASATGPLGPFTDRGSPLVLAPPGSCFGVIDPTFYHDDATGANWVVYKHDGNSCGRPTDVLAAPLSADGLTVTGAATLLLTNDPASWEGGVTEAPWVMRNGSALFLFYSGAAYDQPSYALGVARSTGGMRGPWVKYAGNPVLRSAPGAGAKGSPLHFGPGHCSVVVGAGGGWAFVYAAERPGGGARHLMLDAIEWTADGWPVAAHGGVPSNVSEPLP